MPMPLTLVEITNMANRTKTKLQGGKIHVGRDVVCDYGQCRKRWCKACKLHIDWSGCPHLRIDKSLRRCTKHNPNPAPLVQLRGYKQGVPVYA